MVYKFTVLLNASISVYLSAGSSLYFEGTEFRVRRSSVTFSVRSSCS